MQSATQRIILVRHGETEWSKSGQHTGRTDIPLTDEGRRRALLLGRYLKSLAPDARVYTSPLSRARETCQLAGFGAQATIAPDLLEWDYGIYEGRTTLDIRKEQPDWSVWKAEIQGGEALEQVAARTRRIIEQAGDANAIFFAHGHVLRILAACWIGLPPKAGRLIALDTATISVLGYERKTRVIRQWNVTPGDGPA